MFINPGYVHFNETEGRYIYTERWQSEHGYDSNLFQWLSSELGENEATSTGVDRYEDMPICGFLSLTVCLDNAVYDLTPTGSKPLEAEKDSIRFEVGLGEKDWELRIILLDEIEISTRLLSELSVTQSGTISSRLSLS